MVIFNHIMFLSGRRSLPVTWSPDDNLRKQNYYNSSKKVAKPPAVKTGSTLRSAAYMRRLLGPEDCYIKKSKNKKTDSVNMMTTRANHNRISFTPEKLAFIDMSTPLKFKLLPLEKPQVKKPVSKLNLDVVASPESHVPNTRKRAHDNDGESSLSALKKSKTQL